MHSKHSATENGVESPSSTASHVAVQNYMSNSDISSSNVEVETDSCHPEMQSRVELSPLQHHFSSAMETVVPRDDSEMEEQSMTEVELWHAEHGTKQMIRVSAENIVTESASRGSWFWSKKSPDHSNKAASDKSTSQKRNVVPGVKVTAKSVSSHKELPVTNKHGIDSADGPGGLAGSSTTGKGDTSHSSLSASDVESNLSAAAQDNSQFSRNSSVENPTTSTPVRENRHVERQIDPARQISSSSDGARSPPTDTIHSSPLSRAFILPETSISSCATTETHTSGFSSIQSEKVSVTHEAVVIARASRQSSAVVTEFDESRFEMLLREKAGLEGRLEVLERENTEMLQQQSELKQRAAMAEQQVKTFMSTSQALSADRSAMAVDLETLRQNRTRLEVVIVDAHKLLEEKEADVRTLERDLELARLAGEKHLEKVADVRREITSRDATVRDLKAKITELYVQSQTSDQSCQVLEGELAAIRADVAALMEAKDWYANQLRATQKDRSRLQQETAAARAETITANVASERLRAENVRVKRNLAEVEQRVLTEKQTLARHLEEIEADMLAREAALTVQLRQATESSDRQTSEPPSHDESEELSHLKAELRRSSERAEAVDRENLELSRRLALAQQCVIDRDEMVKSLERDRESAEVRAETAEQDAALRAADVQRLESERSELQLQLESAGKERMVIDQSLQTLRRDTAVLETSFRRMQQDLAAKTAEVEKLSSLKTRASEEQLSEVWPDTEAAAGLKTSKETQKSADDSSVLTRKSVADKEIQYDGGLSESAGGSARQERVCMATTDTQTEESTFAVVTERAEKSITVDNVVLHSDVISSALETSDTVKADVGSRIIEHSQQMSSDNRRDLELALTEKLRVIDQLNEELASVKACLSKTQLELEAADKHGRVLESEKMQERNKGDVPTESLVLNMREDSDRISSILDSTDSAGDLARVHSTEKSSLHQRREVQSQTDEVSLPTNELQQQFDAIELQVTTLEKELDTSRDEKLQLESAKASAELEASTTAERLVEVEKQLQQTQGELVQLERQLSEADSSSLEVHNGAVKRLENDKLSLQSQLDELVRAHQKDVSRLKSKVCCCVCAVNPVVKYNLWPHSAYTIVKSIP